jgi:hypothetical protein
LNLAKSPTEVLVALLKLAGGRVREEGEGRENSPSFEERSSAAAGG